MRIFLTILFLSSSLVAQTDSFRLRADRIPVGNLYHYTKSNLDGSHTGHFYIYIVDRDHIEVLKLEPDANDAVYIRAKMDWETFSETDISMFHIRRGDVRRHIFDGKLQGNEFQLTLDPEQKMISPPFQVPNIMVAKTGDPPVHIYGFELIGLNLSMPHIRNANSDFRVSLIGDNSKFSAEDPNVLTSLGDLRVKHIGAQPIRGHNCRLYSLTSPAFPGREGSMWVNKKTGLIELLQSPMPNNSDWKSLRLALQETRKLTLDEWRTWMKDEAARHIAAVEARP